MQQQVNSYNVGNMGGEQCVHEFNKKVRGAKAFLKLTIN